MIHGGNQSLRGSKPNPFTSQKVIHAQLQRCFTGDILQEANDGVARARPGADKDENAFAVRLEASAWIVRECSVKTT